MRKLLLFGVLLGGCIGKHYYVANLYQHDGQIYVEKCAVYDNGHADTANPPECHIAPIPELPAAALKAPVATAR